MRKRIVLLLAFSLETWGPVIGGPFQANDYFSQVLKLENEQRFEEAIALSKSQIERDPSHCLAYRYLMRLSAKFQRIDKALSYIEQRHRADPSNYCLDYALGYYLSKYVQDYDSAWKHLQAAVKLNPDGFEPYYEEGWIYYAFRMYGEARKSYEQALSLAKRANDPIGELESTYQIAVLYRDLGKLDKALNSYHEILSLSRMVNDVRFEVEIPLTLADIYRNLGDLAEAEQNAREAIKAHQTFGRDTLWYAYFLMGTVILAKGDRQAALGNIAAAYDAYRAAIDYYDRSWASWATLWPAERQRILVYLGEAYLKSDDLETAWRYYNLFLQTAPDNIFLKPDHSKAFGDVGSIYLRKGDYNQALAFFNRAADVARDDGDARQELLWLKRIGDTHAEKGDYDQAREYYEKILKKVSNGSFESGPTSERFVFYGSELNIYEAIVDLLLRMDKQHPEKDYARKALDYLEQAKAGSMLEVLIQNRTLERLLEESAKDNPLRQEAPAGEGQEKLARLRADLSQLHKERGEKIKRKLSQRQDPAAVRLLDNDIKALNGKIGESYRQLTSLVRSRLRLDDRSQLVDQIQKRLLKDNEALVEYMVTDDRTFVFVLTKEAFNYEVLPVGRLGYKFSPAGKKEPVDTLQKLVRNVSPRLFPMPDGDLRNRSAIDAVSANIKSDALATLYTTLVQPIEKYLPPNAALTIVPDDVLYYLPFEMLVTDPAWRSSSSYLVLQHPISYAYSAGSLLERPVSAHSPQTALLIGNPAFGQAWGTNATLASNLRASPFVADGKLLPLPYAEDEVRRISRIVGKGMTLVGLQATKSAFKQNAPQARIIHLATHALTDRRNYWDSAIFFAQPNETSPREGEDGVLYLHEVMNLKLKAALVVLTGCETGLGRLRRGGGLEGMSRAFLAAGVPSVVGTLWPVEDNQVTSSLVEKFYEYLAQGLDKREALQKAKRDILAAYPTLEPFYWAAPILIGDPQPVKLAKSFPVFFPTMVVFIGLLMLFFYLARKYKFLASY